MVVYICSGELSAFRLYLAHTERSSHRQVHGHYDEPDKRLCFPPLVQSQHRQGERCLGPYGCQHRECRRNIAHEADGGVVGWVDDPDVLTEPKGSVVSSEDGAEQEENLNGGTNSQSMVVPIATSSCLSRGKAKRTNPPRKPAKDYRPTTGLDA
jgi:hypothetical protein